MSALHSKVRVVRLTFQAGESVDLSGRKRPVEERDLEERRREREALQRQLRREVVRDRRMEVAGKKKEKATRDQERDVSERIALGQAQPTSRDAMYDQRLFNQTSGLDSGFGYGDDENTLYDKPLFTDRTAASIYKNVKELPDDEFEDEEKRGVGKVLRHAPHRGFEGTDYKADQGGRSRPVEFEHKVGNNE